ncbi:MAG: IS30 family transposase [Lachnospiraceae bacterium]
MKDIIELEPVKSNERKGKALSKEEREKIAVYLQIGYTPYKIGKLMNRAANTIRNEIERGSTEFMVTNYKSVKMYDSERGDTIYRKNKQNSRRTPKYNKCIEYLEWACKRILEDRWTPAVCYHRALLLKLFKKSEMVCTRTFYTYIDKGYLIVRNIDLPEKVARKSSDKTGRKRKKWKRLQGRSIELRPDIKGEAGHWEIDTVIGKREKGAVLMTITERVSKHEVTYKIPDKSAKSIDIAMKKFIDEYEGAVKSITADNGSEFAELWKYELCGIQIYYAHAYSSWERGVNEGMNKMIRQYIPKGRRIENYSHEYIEEMVKSLNNKPRHSLGYLTPDEVFQKYLEKAKNTS